MVMENNGDEELLYKSDKPSDKFDDIDSITYNEKENEYHIVLNGALDDTKVQKAIYNRRNHSRIKKFKNGKNPIIKPYKNKTYIDKHHFQRLVSNDGGSDKYIVGVERELGDGLGDGINKDIKIGKGGIKMNKKLTKKQKAKQRKLKNRNKFKIKKDPDILDKMSSKKRSKKKEQESVKEPSRISKILHYLNPLTYIKGAYGFIKRKLSSKTMRKRIDWLKNHSITILKIAILLPIIFIIRLVQRRFIILGSNATNT